MRKERTISEAAQEALRAIGKPSSISEIYEKIRDLELYHFNTPTPEHVLRTEIRRKVHGVERVDSRTEVVFKMIADEIYDVMKDTPQRRSTVGTKRIQRATDKAGIIQTLTSDEAGSFREIWRVLLFAAVLGFKNQRREPLASFQSGDGIRQDSFANNPIWPGILYLMGLVDTSGTDVLMASEEAEDLRIRIFEEYANGGLAILKQEFETTTCSLDAILSYLQSQVLPVEPGKPDLEITI